MSKLKVLFSAADSAGCGYYRCQIPARGLQRLGLADTKLISHDEPSLDGHVLVIQRNVAIDRLEMAKYFQKNGGLFVTEEDDNFRALPEDNMAFTEFHPYFWMNEAWNILQNINQELPPGPRHDHLSQLRGMVKDIPQPHCWEPSCKLEFCLAGRNRAQKMVSVLVPRNNFHEVHRKTVASADLVTVTTDGLADAYRGLNSNIVVLPNCIDLQEPCYQQIRKPHEGIVIGWAGSLTHVADLAIVGGTISQLMLKYDGTGGKPLLKLMMGSDSRIYHQIFNHLPGVPEFMEKVAKHYGERGTMARSMDDMESEVDTVTSDCGRYMYRRALPPDKFPMMFSDIDIGIVPLRHKIKFTGGKSDLKGLEMAGMGVPIVTSPTVPYVNWRPWETGAIVTPKNKHKEWYKALDSLISQESFRQLMADRALQWSRSRSIDTWAPAWFEAYATAMHRQGKLQIKAA